MKRSLTILLTLIAILAMAFPASARMIAEGDDPVPAGAAGKAVVSGNYIIQMADLPAVDYAGGIRGYRATATNGQKLDPTNANVRKYAAYLDSKHAAVLDRVGGEKLYDYHFTFNGFAARLSPAQVEQLKQQPGVVSVTADEMRSIDTTSTPAFVGLTQPGGLWDQLGGPGSAGEGIIVGMLDSGLWPESPSFADDGTFRAPGPRWGGACQTGEEWPDGLCNNKLIGARFYNVGFGGNAGIDANRPWEFNSPRDYNSHGSHTSSTAAGNHGVQAITLGNDLGQISGMAPRAHLAMYKVCWSTVDGATANCATIDSVAAIEDATADGVDVINFSIGGSTTSFTDPVAIAFLNAAATGIFVAASAGNSGPGASTVAHNYPWVTTVAAGTHDRAYVSSVTLGDGTTYDGISNGSGTDLLPLIQSTAAGLPGADPERVRLCYSTVDTGGTPVLDPALVAGKIVLCDRGVTARVNKSLAVMEAGGLGVILANTSPSSLNADIHYVPTIHVDEVVGAAIKTYIASAGAGATAQIAPGVQVTAEAPFVAAFSSRGPARAGGGDLLKPDIMAPGVDVLAATSPAIAGRDFDFLSGTSMSSPHVAGFAALLKNLHPDWSPAMIKSALMTTAGQTTNAGNPIPGTPFDFGAGQAAPTSAADPGLVYAARARDWVAFLCGQGLVTDPRCPAIAIDASDLNYPSIAIGDLAGIQTIRRTVTNVSAKKSTYTVSVSAPAGVDVVVSPTKLTLLPGQSKSYTVKFTRTTAALNASSFGSLTWSDGRHAVRSPIAIRPVALAAPLQVSGDSSGISYNVTFGYDGSFSAAPRGLVPAVTFEDIIETNQSLAYDVVVPAGTTYARFALFDAYTTAPDLDMRVFRGTTLVGSSGGATSQEQVNFTNPVAATYTVVVDGFDTGGGPASFTLFTWVLGTADAGNMTVSAPTTAVLGQTGTISLSFSGLAPGMYLGSVVYDGTTGMPNPTIVVVDVP
jgi:subtilisin family serine protease